MVWLVASILALLAGGGGGALAGRRGTRDLTASGRQRIARWSTIALAGLAGTLLGASLLLVAHELNEAASVHEERVLLDTLTVVTAFTHILFYGGLLVALATIVALIGRRAARAQRP